MRTGFFWAKIMVNGEKWGLPTGIGVGDMALEVGGTRGMEVGGTRGLGVGGHGALPGFRGRAVGGDWSLIIIFSLCIIWIPH